MVEILFRILCIDCEIKFKKMVNYALVADTRPVFCHLMVGINCNYCALVPHKPYFRT